MLGLVEGVEGDLADIGGGIGKDDRFARAGRRTRIDAPGQQALGGHEPGAAGANDLVAARDRFGAVCGRGDGLRPAGLVYPRDAAEGAGVERCVVDPAIGGRRRQHGDFLDPGDDGGNRRHQRDGGKRALAARHVAGNGADRCPALAGEHARRHLLDPHVLGHLGLVEAADRVGGELQGFLQFRLQPGLGACEIGRGGADRVGADVGPVETRRAIHQRRVAAPGDIIHHGRTASMYGSRSSSVRTSNCA